MRYLFFIITIIFFLSGCETKTPCDTCNTTGKTGCNICGGDKIYTINKDCEYCNNGYSECSECEGEGTVKCINCDGDGQAFKPCNVCGGSGMQFYPSGYAEPCYVCGGAGMRFEPCFQCNGDGKEECKDCDGEGKVVCSYCSGEGYKTVEKNCDNCDENGNINCYKCNGKGYIVK
jgi:DnaJ-class molecular chaperone